MRWCILLLLSGCMLSGMNQEGLQFVVDDLKQSQDQLVVVAQGLNKITVELNAAIEQKRPPLLEPIIVDTSMALSTAADSLTEAGKTAVTLQSGIGTPKTQSPPLTPAQKELWRTRYVVMAKLFNQLKNWVGSRLPFVSKVNNPQPSPWSGSDIATLIATIMTGATALGLGGKKTLEWKRGASEAEGIAEKLKEKCNGDLKEFAGVIEGFPATVRRHRKKKVNEI